LTPYYTDLDLEGLGIELIFRTCSMG